MTPLFCRNKPSSAGSGFGVGRATAIAAFVVAAAVGQSLPATRLVAAQRSEGPRWELSALNPVIGVEHPPKGFADGKRPAIWNDPSVLVEDGGYSMWASVGRGGPQGVAIYKLRSSDGEHWDVQNGGRPVLEPGGKSDFDSLGVETPAVVRAGDVYHMYYSAYPHGKLPLVTIGHAVSPDGIRWTKRGELTSLTRVVGQNSGNPWGWLGRGEPAAVYDHGVFFLYFSDVHCRQNDCKGSPAAMRGISLATSTDGQTFEQRGREPVVQASQSYPASAGWEGYSTPWALVHDGVFELFCDAFRTVGKASIQTSLVRMQSSDGVHFQETAHDMLVAGTESWAAVSVRSPSVVFADGVWRMWYAGDNYDPATSKPRGNRLNAGIGFATLRAR